MLVLRHSFLFCLVFLFLTQGPILLFVPVCTEQYGRGGENLKSVLTISNYNFSSSIQTVLSEKHRYPLFNIYSGFRYFPFPLLCGRPVIRTMCRRDKIKFCKERRLGLKCVSE